MIFVILFWICPANRYVCTVKNRNRSCKSIATETPSIVESKRKRERYPELLNRLLIGRKWVSFIVTRVRCALCHQVAAPPIADIYWEHLIRRGVGTCARSAKGI